MTMGHSWIVPILFWRYNVKAHSAQFIDILFPLVGVSLSESHTSVTAFQDACVCMTVCVWPYTENLN